MRGEGRLLFPGRALGSPLMSDTADKREMPMWATASLGQRACEAGTAPLQLSGSLRIRKGRKKRQQIYCVILNILSVF